MSLDLASSTSLHLSHLRFVGGLLTLSPKYAFVVEDEDCHICGYLAAALDARRFWTKYEMAYLPALRSKYPSPPADHLPAVVKVTSCI